MQVIQAIQKFFHNPFRFEPISQQDLIEISQPHAQPNEVWRIACPCGGTLFRENQVQADGNVYQTGGLLELANGQKFRASFNIDTAKEAGKQVAQIFVLVKQEWYALEDDYLMEVLGLSHQDVFPYTLQTDREFVQL